MDKPDEPLILQSRCLTISRKPKIIMMPYSRHKTAIINEAEEACATAGGGKVMIDGPVSADSLKKMKSLYVTDPDGKSNIHHKSH